MAGSGASGGIAGAGAGIAGGGCVAGCAASEAGGNLEEVYVVHTPSTGFDYINTTLICNK